MSSKLRKFNTKIKVNFKFMPDFLQIYKKNQEVFSKDLVKEKINDIINEYIRKEKILNQRTLSIIDYYYDYAKINQREINDNETYLDIGATDGSSIIIYLKIKYILRRLREISLDQLITRSEILLEKNRKNISFSSSLKNLIKKPRKNEFIPIQYEIIPETINDNMFDQ